MESNSESDIKNEPEPMSSGLQMEKGSTIERTSWEESSYDDWPTRRNFDSRRVSKSILKEILSEIHKVNDMTPCRIIKIKKAEVPKEKEIMEARKQEKKTIPLSKSSSMASLIMWNVSKALDLQPSLDLKSAIMGVQLRLHTDDGRDMNSTSKDHPEEQHLLCALLAWQQLGHHDAESLYSFVEFKKEEMEKSNHTNQNSIHESIKSINMNRNPTTTSKVFTSKPSVDGSFGVHTTGPIIRLPVESVVMQIANDQQQGCRSNKCCHGKSKRLENDIMGKLVEAGAVHSSCAEALAILDSKTSHLQARAAQLARREARRVQLLERAEAAWVDLEAGYQKRFALAQEKEDDLKKQITKMTADEAQFKDKCYKYYPEILHRKENDMMDARAILTNLEKEVCELANTKLRLSEESARAEAALAEELYKSAQYERDLKFQEEQARRLLESAQNEAEAARALTCEAERAMRAELAGLRKQIGDVSNDLLAEDNANLKVKAEHDELRKEKAGLIEDLEGCKAMCDKKMQGQLDELKKKKEQLLELADQYLKCQCQMPMDKNLQVERTPSVAAMCNCEPEDNLQESCSCTSLQNRLLSSLLSDLFSGLQGELSQLGSRMPCQLLKCLQDNHNWDRRTDTKSNIRSYFSKLLKSELDIAIATSIENYHAKWVGNACADSVKMLPTLEDDLKEGWQQRAIERRAQQMANQLTEELLQERTEEIEQRTLARIKAGPPPCVCKPPAPADDKCTPDCCTKTTALFPCLVLPSSPFMPSSSTSNAIKLELNHQADETSPPAIWKQTIQEVMQLKHEIEDLKKESVKKEDLKLMKDDISKIVRECSVIENQDLEVIAKNSSKYYGQSIKKETKFLRAAKKDEYPKTSHKNKLEVHKSSATKDNKNVFIKDERPTKLSKRHVHDQTYAVNLCLCGPQKNDKSLQNARLNNSEKWKPKSLKNVMPQSSIAKQIKPINVSLPSTEQSENSSEISELCKSDCKCFRKMPSNTSIDNLLETLATCNFDLVSRETYKHQTKNCLSKCSPSVVKKASHILPQNDTKNIVSFLRKSHNTQVNASDIMKQNYSNKNVSIITESNKNLVNLSYTIEDTPMRNSKQNRSFTKQPATTESEYMGTVYLDKSHENICKCLINLDESDHEKYEDGKNNIPFQCINTNTCGCTMYLDIHKDNKRSQTEEFTKEQVQSYQCQVTRSKVASKFKEFNSSPINSNYLNSQREIKLKSDLNNVPQNTKLFSSSGECCIQFLGVTLDDLSSIKNKKSKPVDHNVGDLIIPKDNKHIVCGRKLQKKSSNIEQSNSLPKHNGEKKYQTGFDDCTKCEYKAKFEEFTGFVKNFLDSKLVENTHQDKGFDTKSFKEAVNTIGSCVSCNGVNVDDSGDLELNAFHLLEDHIKQKFEDYKSFSCNICISPEEEQQFYSTILQRVKQVISDYANKMKCGCSKRLPYNGSWDRAYGLLQEYLKIKIKRVQCLCVVNENKRDVILPEVLEKVCNLIESDFQRLKDFCTCKNSTETRTKIVRIGDLEPPTELPEKDTNISQAMYNDVEVQHFSTVTKYSKQNSNNSMIHKENVSSQANPTFRMEAKSCAIEPYSNRNIKSTETNHIFTDSKSNGVMYNTCDCSHNTDKVDIRKFPEMFGTKEILVNLYTEQSGTNTESCELPKFGIDNEPSRCVSAIPVKSMETITVITMSEHGERIQDAQNRAVDKQPPCAPYIGFTVDCTCDRALGHCFCMKSVVQANNDKIDSGWKEWVGRNNNNRNFPYIMHGTKKVNREDAVNCHSSPDDVNFHSYPDDVLTDKTSKTVIPRVDIPTRQVGSIAENEEDIVLKHSVDVDSDNFSNQVSNTLAECLSFEDTADTCSSDAYPVDWPKIPVAINSGRSNTAKLANSIYFPGQKNDYENNSIISGSGTNPVPSKMAEGCGCQKVPICHVKMLVEHIEKNLVELKCTCDSLISKVCPVHSKRVF